MTLLPFSLACLPPLQPRQKILIQRKVATQRQNHQIFLKRISYRQKMEWNDELFVTYTKWRYRNARSMPSRTREDTVASVPLLFLQLIDDLTFKKDNVYVKISAVQQKVAWTFIHQIKYNRHQGQAVFCRLVVHSRLSLDIPWRVLLFWQDIHL